MQKKHIQKNKGAAMLLSVIFFLFISLATISGVVSPVVANYQNNNVNLNSKKAFYLAESGVEDAVYRISTSKPISSTENLSLDGQTTTTNITTLGNQKTIESTGVFSRANRIINTSLVTGGGIAFNYGLQAGNGGIIMDGGASLIGNIYSNGNVSAVSADVTGSVIAADGANLSINTENVGVIPPTSNINFRNTSGAQDFAQSFQVNSTLPVVKTSFYIRKVGSPANATLRLVADSGSNNPSTTNIPIGTTTLNSAQVTTSYGWVEVVFATNVSLMPNTRYWIVLDNSTQNSSNYYQIASTVDTAYTSGTAKTGAYNGSWTTLNTDSYFRVYTGGTSSIIGGATYSSGFQVGGEVWGSVVRGTTTPASLFCITGTNNNKACNTTRGSAPYVPLPFSESNINDWKNSALVGGTLTGNQNFGWQGGTLGPKKIVGNLAVNGGGTLTLTGPIWVTGNVTVNGGGKIVLPSGYSLNSETIVADGIVDISGGGSLGSGTSGSYLFIVSTSQCPYSVTCGGNSAIRISGGAGAIAVSAQYGEVLLNGGANLKAAVGNYLRMTGGADVVYEQGLASPSFQSGPSGSWVVDSWREGI